MTRQPANSAKKLLPIIAEQRWCRVGELRICALEAAVLFLIDAGFTEPEAIDAIKWHLTQRPKWLRLIDNGAMPSHLEATDDLDHWVQWATARKRRHRRRTLPSSRPLTPKQLETMKVVGDCNGSISEAARQMGKDRKTVSEAYLAGRAKLAAAFNSKKPRPVDPRILEAGPESEGRTTRQRKKRSSDS